MLSTPHLAAAKRVPQYLKECPNLGCVVYMMGGGPVSLESVTKILTALSTLQPDLIQISYDAQEPTCHLSSSAHLFRSTRTASAY